MDFICKTVDMKEETIFLCLENVTGVQTVCSSDLLDNVRISQSVHSVAQSCPNLCDPMDCGMPGLPIHHQLPEITQTHVH